eukprot:SAG31_NODE_23362_length_506_cov_0.633907_1_plen_56_part_00
MIRDYKCRPQEAVMLGRDVPSTLYIFAMVFPMEPKPMIATVFPRMHPAIENHLED